MGCSDVIFCALHGWLINGWEAWPKWKPGLCSCLSLSFSHGQLSAGTLHPPGMVLAAEVLCEPVARAELLVNKCLLEPGPSRTRGWGWHGRGSVQGDPGCCGPAPAVGRAVFGVWQRVLSENRTLKISETCPLSTFPVEQWQPAAPVTPDPSGSLIQAIVPQFPCKLICGRRVFDGVSQRQDLLPSHARWLQGHCVLIARSYPLISPGSRRRSPPGNQHPG